MSNYWYDADGERTVKTSGESDQVYVNGVFSGGSTNTAKFSLYVSPYLVANQGGRYTKHIYAGSQRIVSKVGDFASYGSDPRRIEYAGSNTDGLSVDYKAKYAAQQQVIKNNYKTFDVPYNGTDNDNYADGEGFCCNDGSMEAAMARAQKTQTRAAAKSFKDPDNYENLQFFYHPDHLGSSSFITNLEGEVVQHIEYVPFGEVFIEERNSVWNTPYLFNAKEFDEETGMYYYGARYYEPRLSLWMSVDPIYNYDPRNSENYLDGEHNGGVLNPYNLNPYVYCYQSPVIFIDPNGKQTIAPALPRVVTRLSPRAIPINPLGIRIPIPPIAPVPQYPAFPDNAKPAHWANSSDWSKVDLKDTKTWPKPPTDGKFREGDPSRNKPKNRGEKSPYDDKGGEWRPHLPDKYHPEGHWDYKPSGTNSQWEDIYPNFVLPSDAGYLKKGRNKIREWFFKLKIEQYQKQMRKYEQQQRECQPIA